MAANLRLGDEAPDFTAETTEGKINLYEYLGEGWGILFSQLAAEFAKRNAKVLAVSVDPIESHQGWVNDINETQGTTVNFPIIADPDRTVADLYGMIHPNASDTVTVRSVFIIGPDKKVKLTITYPQSAGRNFAEILRVLDSLQLSAKYSVSTPADWKDGEDVIIMPSVSDEAAKEKFPKGWKAIKPYLRLTPQPNK